MHGGCARGGDRYRPTWFLYIGWQSSKKKNTAAEIVCDLTKIKKIEIWVEEINGIQYYLDNDKNVYLPEDIINNSKTTLLMSL